MAKDTKNKFQPMNELEDEMRKLKKKMGKIMIPCPHTNSNGKLKGDFLSQTEFLCKRCKCEFDFGIVSSDEAYRAIRTVHNMINQIKAMSDDPERESAVIEQLGNLDYNLKELGELYNKTVRNNSRGGKKKKKNKDNNAFGNYGTNNIKFIN